MTDIERVARAIIVTRIPSYADDETWTEHWAWYLRGRGQCGSADSSSLAIAEREARAALDAIRHATPHQLAAGWAAINKGRTRPVDMAPGPALREAYPAMIDVLLGDMAP